MKPKIFGMKEANQVGISRLVRESEDSPLVILRRNGADVAMVLPLTWKGIQRVQAMFKLAMTDPGKLKDNPDLLSALQYIMGPGFDMVAQKTSEGLTEGTGNAEERPASAVQGEGTKRRRKSPALKSK